MLMRESELREIESRLNDASHLRASPDAKRYFAENAESYIKRLLETVREFRHQVPLRPGKHHCVMCDVEIEHGPDCLLFAFHFMAGFRAGHMMFYRLPLSEIREVALVAYRLGLIGEKDFGKKVQVRWSDSIGKHFIADFADVAMVYDHEIMRHRQVVNDMQFYNLHHRYASKALINRQALEECGIELGVSNHVINRECPSCDCSPGEFHWGCCSMERCPQCGFSIASCDCICDFHQVAPECVGEELYSSFMAHWHPHRDIWIGENANAATCRKLGFWAYFVPDPDGIHGKWVRCGADHPEATEDLNRIYAACHWNQKNAGVGAINGSQQRRSQGSREPPAVDRHQQIPSRSHQARRA